MSKNSLEIADSLLQKARLARLHVVQLPLPDDFRFTGFVPFDMSITDGIATIKIPASSYEEAESFGKKFLGIDE